jgi:hypothetical protein
MAITPEPEQEKTPWSGLEARWEALSFHFRTVEETYQWWQQTTGSKQPKPLTTPHWLVEELQAKEQLSPKAQRTREILFPKRPSDHPLRRALALRKSLERYLEDPVVIERIVEIALQESSRNMLSFAKAFLICSRQAEAIRFVSFLELFETYLPSVASGAQPTWGVTKKRYAELSNTTLQLLTTFCADPKYREGTIFYLKNFPALCECARDAYEKNKAIAKILDPLLPVFEWSSFF